MANTLADKDSGHLSGRLPSSGSKRPPRVQSACLVILTVLAVLYVLYAAASLIFPIVLAVLIAIPLLAPVQMLVRLHVPRVAAALLVFCLSIVIVGAAMFWLSEPAAQWIKDAPDNLQQVEWKLRNLSNGTWDDVQEASAKVAQITAAADDAATLQVKVKRPSWTARALDATGGFLVGMVVCASLVFLLLAFGDRLLDKIVDLFPPGWDQRNIRQMCHRVRGIVSRYLFSFGAINVLLGLVIGTGMWLIGMPNPFLWGVMATFLNFIPFVGLVMGTLTVALVAIISFESTWYAMLAPAIYLGANGLEANFLTPALLGRSLKLDVIFVLLSIVVWSWMWGVGGALIAVPLLATLKIACDHFEPMQPLGRLLSG